VEIKCGRNYTLADDVASGRLDVALAFTPAGKGGENTLATVPTAWFGRRTGRSGTERGSTLSADGVVPLVVFDGPCLFREIGIAALARSGTPWRLAMTTPSLASLCCGVQAGLGLMVRTALAAIPRGLAIVPSGAGLPELPPIDIVLYCSPECSPAVQTFRDLLLEVIERECHIDTRARVTTGAQRRESREAPAARRGTTGQKAARRRPGAMPAQS
jgi:DNA-binding transcriptional LysR family regulator